MTSTLRHQGGAARVRPSVIVTGFMGTGKTETGRALARLLGLEFVDTDALIEKREGATIAEIFATRSEEYFRSLEERVCSELADRSGLVVATGGGTLVEEGNLEMLSRKGTVVLLEASLDAILERVKTDDQRPLLGRGDSRGEGRSVTQGEPDGPSTRERVLRLLKDRESAYHRIELRVDTTELSPLVAACRVASLLHIDGDTLMLHTAKIEIGRGLLSKLGDRLCSLDLDSTAFLLMPDGVSTLFLDQLTASLDSASIPWTHIPVRDGDGRKTLEQAGELLDQLALYGADRGSVVVAIGGGVTGDLAGFVASVYMRGIPLVHVPTTLLAQVDSSIGGKVAVNHAHAKNLAGSFYQPRYVLSDPCALRSLPDREISNGMAEVVKTAILGAPSLFEFIEHELAETSGRALRDAEFLEQCVAHCALVKASIVERDPFEQGERRVLNLGHTIGHAFEAAAGYSGMTHGEAVSVGLVAATRIALARGLVDEGFLDRVTAVLAACGLPITPPPCNRAELAKSIRLDKKILSGRLHFVLPVRLGSVEVFDDVTEDEMFAAIEKGTE